MSVATTCATRPSIEALPPPRRSPVEVDRRHAVRRRATSRSSVPSGIALVRPLAASSAVGPSSSASSAARAVVGRASTARRTGRDLPVTEEVHRRGGSSAGCRDGARPVVVDGALVVAVTARGEVDADERQSDRRDPCCHRAHRAGDIVWKSRGGLARERGECPAHDGRELESVAGACRSDDDAPVPLEHEAFVGGVRVEARLRRQDARRRRRTGRRPPLRPTPRPARRSFGDRPGRSPGPEWCRPALRPRPGAGSAYAACPTREIPPAPGLGQARVVDHRGHRLCGGQVEVDDGLARRHDRESDSGWRQQRRRPRARRDDDGPRGNSPRRARGAPLRPRA